jgi:L-fucose mutarotase
MLKPLNPLLGPRLLATSCSIGHSDRCVRVDAKPPVSVPVIGPCGTSTVRTLDAMLSVMPLSNPLAEAVWPIARELPIFAERHARLRTPLAVLQPFAFHKRTREALAGVATAGGRLSHKLLLKKGVIPPDEVAR